MLYRVTPLRREGVPLLKSELVPLKPGYLIVGDHHDDGQGKKPRSFNRVAYILGEAPMPNNRTRISPVLFDPELVSSDDREMILRGVEIGSIKRGDRMVNTEHIQVWLCERV